MDKREFAAKIKEFRLKTSKSLYEIAQLLHTGAGTVSRWEEGIAAPPDVAREAIIEIIKNRWI
jgi:DNA-binding transcriptional regulator YiaG